MFLAQLKQKSANLIDTGISVKINRFVLLGLRVNNDNVMSPLVLAQISMRVHGDYAYVIVVIRTRLCVNIVHV